MYVCMYGVGTRDLAVLARCSDERSCEATDGANWSFESSIVPMMNESTHKMIVGASARKALQRSTIGKQNW